ncbi:MAG: XdhC family protein, partial [Acetomicrobium flavidum]|nr:XdhC family protein [Acetomicrobium flavidum]
MDLTIVQALKDSIEKGKRSVLCTVIDEEGSAPRNVGAKMLVWEDGSIVGTIGGGILEYHVIQEALKLIREGRPSSLYSEEFTATEPTDTKAA